MTGEERLPRILYVEDDEGLAHLARRALTRAGFEVVPADRVRDGLVRFREELIDAVVLDHFLPDGSGMDFLREIGPAAETVPVVYVTASSEARVAVEALTGGASDYVVKSLDADFFPLLQAALKKALRNARLKAEKEQADKLLRAAKERAELMLAEMNHRIANSPSLVSAMIRMQINAVSGEDIKDALAETQSRIAAVAELHRSLYTSEEIDEVDLCHYLGSLIASIENGAYRVIDPVSITHVLEHVTVSADKAVALGVIVTELLTNALKYAYPQSSGEIQVELRSGKSELHLTVADHGVGHDPDEKARGSGLGSKLIGAMISNLSGRLDHNAPAGGGTRVEVSWPNGKERDDP